MYTDAKVDDNDDKDHMQITALHCAVTLMVVVVVAVVIIISNKQGRSSPASYACLR
jgi:hypothetical protein